MTWLAMHHAMCHTSGVSGWLTNGHNKIVIMVLILHHLMHMKWQSVFSVKATLSKI
jgi:hypothetical protein